MTTKTNYKVPQPSERLIHYEDIGNIPQAWQKQYDDEKENSKALNAKWNDTRTVSAYCIVNNELKSGDVVYGESANGQTFVKKSKDLLTTDMVIGSVIQSSVCVSLI